MASSRIVVGRLLELDLGAGFKTTEEVDVLGAAIASVLFRHGAEGGKLVVIADWRRFELASPEVAERMATLMRRNSPIVERNAFLHRQQSPSMFQLFRIVQEAENANRRLFTDASELLSWVSEILLPAEIERARQFLQIEG